MFHPFWLTTAQRVGVSITEPMNGHIGHMTEAVCGEGAADPKECCLSTRQPTDASRRLTSEANIGHVTDAAPIPLRDAACSCRDLPTSKGEPAL